MSYKVITAPATEPVTVAEARTFCGLGSDTSHDSLLTLFIQSAREGLERELNRALITQTIEDEHECFPDSGRFTLRFVPVTSITSFKYYDSDEAVYDISEYTKILNSEPASVTLTDDFSWPEDVLAVKIRYVAGYASASAVPARIKEAILMQVRDSFDCRQNGIIKPGMTVSDRLVQTFKVWHPEVNV